MENEVSGIAKLGIVLIALAVLIGLGFGIFQISKGTANSGVNDVQAELDGVATSAYTTYDQTVITGTMVRSAVSDFEGENCAVLIAPQAWVNFLHDNTVAPGTLVGAGASTLTKASGIDGTYVATVNELPVVFAYGDKAFTTEYGMSPSSGAAMAGKASFINYNTLLGSNNAAAAGIVVAQTYTVGSTPYYMAGIYFDSNCFICTTGFLTDASGKTLTNNVVKNLSKTGTTEFIPTGGKFQSYLIKDASGTIMGMTFQQIGQ